MRPRKLLASVLAVDGNVIARFASEIASSAITAKAGSLLKWARTR